MAEKDKLREVEKQELLAKLTQKIAEVAELDQRLSKLN